MKPKTKFIDFENEVFNIRNKPMQKKDWWYWLWLFFFNNPKNPERPKQLMILWSSKNEKDIECNGLKLNLSSPKKGSTLKGVVASWYFDGESMHHNFLLDKCNIKFMKQMIMTDSKVPTSFYAEKNLNKIKIGKDFEFIAEPSGSHEFLRPTYEKVNYAGSKGYSMIESRHLKLRGKVRNKPIRGSAYFQRVFFSGLYPSWYWSVIHFENGGDMIYFYSYVFKKPLKNLLDFITFFDGKDVHKFNHAKVNMIGRGNPSFEVSGKNPKEKIDFTIRSYSQSAWTFKKKSARVIPNKLTYNEYPAVASSLKLVDKKTGKRIVLKDLGRSVGNAEYGEGLLL